MAGFEMKCFLHSRIFSFRIHEFKPSVVITVHPQMDGIWYSNYETMATPRKGKCPQDLQSGNKQQLTPICIYYMA